MTQSTATMGTAVKQARSARKSLVMEALDTKPGAAKAAETRASEAAPGEAKATEVKADPAKARRSKDAPKPPLRYRIRLMLTGAAIALALGTGGFLLFGPDDMGPPEGVPASASEASGPPEGLPEGFDAVP
jgi:hypothetical protein